MQTGEKSNINVAIVAQQLTFTSPCGRFMELFYKAPGNYSGAAFKMCDRETEGEKRETR